jgi:hypothetical protein
MQILYPADMVNVGTSLQIGDTPLLPPTSNQGW